MGSEVSAVDGRRPPDLATTLLWSSLMPMPVARDLPLRFNEVRDPDRFRLALAGALLCIFALGARGAHADEAAKPAEPAKPTAPSLTDVLTASGIDLHGYVDTAYSYLSGTGIF